MKSELERVADVLLDRYEIEAEIGRGSVATVYKARDLRHHRDVAVKVLRDELVGTHAAARFLQEIEFTSGLSHPNIVPLYESGSLEGMAYYVMPYIQGRSLRDRLEREGQLPIGEAVRIAAEVAEALSLSHEQGVIHRDIKPENILLSGGHAMVTDFGVARAMERSGVSTTTGIAVGTPLYMSPEQASAEEVDARSDIYALGIVLYEMIAGEPPFRGRTAVAVAARHLREPPAPLTTIRDSVTPELEAVVQQALAKSPADRFQSARDLLNALHLVGATSASLSSTGARLLGTALAARRKKAWRRAAVGAAVGAVAIAAAVATWPREAALRAPELAPSRVIVFPLTTDRGVGGAEGSYGEGADASLAIGMALEHTDPLKWIDGWQLLSPEERSDPNHLTRVAEMRYGRERGAGYFVDGAVLQRGDSVHVSLTLHDVAGDSVAERASVSGSVADGASVDRLGLQALVRLLPTLVEPTRTVDLTHLTDRDPRALALWIQGERAYRGARFEDALDLFRRAVEADSLLALAALRAAPAALWTRRPEMGRELALHALRYRDFLPPRHVSLTEGYVDYVSGRADPAVEHFRAAIAGNEDWGEAWAFLGEAYRHLLPSDLDVDHSAADAFERARTLDPSFIPPLIHLAEYAMWHGDVDTAELYVGQIRASAADPESLARLDLMLACARSGARGVDWSAHSLEEPVTLLEAAKSLLGEGAFPECAERAFRSLLASPAASSVRWGAREGLHGTLMLTGRYAEASAIVDSAVAEGTTAAALLHVLDAFAGKPSQEPADAFVFLVDSLTHGTFQGVRPRTQWVVGLWLARSGRFADLGRLTAALRGTMDPKSPLFLTSLEGVKALTEGDQARALVLLDALPSADSRWELAYEIGAGFPAERLVVACAYLDRGDYREALRAAGALDHPQPVSFVPFLGPGLRVRMEAARRLGADAQADRLRARLEGLGRSDLLDRDACPPNTEGGEP